MNGYKVPLTKTRGQAGLARGRRQPLLGAGLTGLNLMEGTEPNDLPVIEPTASPCLHLRSKGMYVYTDPPEGESYEDDDTTNCWCFQTLKSFGPDDELVGARACRDASRSCYEPI